jgi:hypothetical protein
LDLYIDLLILYQKVQQLLLLLFFEKIKTCPKTAQKPKLKSGFQTAGYKHNNRKSAVIKITANRLGGGSCSCSC